MTVETDLAWLAGIVDGEGCICARWQNRENRSGGSIAIEVRVESTSIAMITKIADICRVQDITFAFEGERWHPKSTKAAYRISIRTIGAIVQFLRTVLPYLVVKKAEAEAVLSWYEQWGDQRGMGKARATREEKVVVFETLKRLKRVT